MADDSNYKIKFQSSMTLPVLIKHQFHTTLDTERLHFPMVHRGDTLEMKIILGWLFFLAQDIYRDA